MLDPVFEGDPLPTPRPTAPGHQGVHVRMPVANAAHGHTACAEGQGSPDGYYEFGRGRLRTIGCQPRQVEGPAPGSVQ